MIINVHAESRIVHSHGIYDEKNAHTCTLELTAH